MSISERFVSRGLLFFTALGAVFCFSSASHAHASFPGDLQRDLTLPCIPPCTICHQDLAGGFGTVVKPFGKAMQAAGLIDFVDITVPTAATQLESNKTDSNGDGVPDIMQLSMGDDPNTGAPYCGVLTPRYGCGAHIANVPAPDNSAPVAALLVACVMGASAHRTARRRRAKASPHTR